MGPLLAGLVGNWFGWISVFYMLMLSNTFAILVSYLVCFFNHTYIREVYLNFKAHLFSCLTCNNFNDAAFFCEVALIASIVSNPGAISSKN